MTDRHRFAPASAGHSSFPWQGWLIGPGVAVILIATIGWWRATSNEASEFDGGIRVVRSVSGSNSARSIASVDVTETPPSIAHPPQPVIDPAYRPLAAAMRQAYPEISHIGTQCAEAACTILAVMPATVEQAAHGRAGGTLSDGIDRVLWAQGYQPLQQIQFEEISAEDIRVRITLGRNG